MPFRGKHNGMTVFVEVHLADLLEGAADLDVEQRRQSLIGNDGQQHRVRADHRLTNRGQHVVERSVKSFVVTVDTNRSGAISTE